MIRADFDAGDFVPLIFLVLLVGGKALEVIFRKITEYRHGLQVSREAPPEERTPPQKKGPYLPYEETMEEIFGPYIELRKRVHEAKAKPTVEEAPPRPQRARRKRRPQPPPPRAEPVVIIEDDIQIIEELPAEVPEVDTFGGGSKHRLKNMNAEEAREAFVASLIFSRPHAYRHRGPRHFMPGSR